MTEALEALPTFHFERNAVESKNLNQKTDIRNQRAVKFLIHLKAKACNFSFALDQGNKYPNAPTFNNIFTFDNTWYSHKDRLEMTSTLPFVESFCGPGE